MIGSGFINVEPAYGRRYSTIEEAQQDWEDGKDFRIQGGGPYINKADWLRYAPEKKVTLFMGSGNYKTLQGEQS